MSSIMELTIDFDVKFPYDCFHVTNDANIFEDHTQSKTSDKDAVTTTSQCTVVDVSDNNVDFHRHLFPLQRRVRLIEKWRYHSFIMLPLLPPPHSLSSLSLPFPS
jgi:hypothetical protein